MFGLYFVLSLKPQRKGPIVSYHAAGSADSVNVSDNPIVTHNRYDQSSFHGRSPFKPTIWNVPAGAEPTDG